MAFHFLIHFDPSPEAAEEFRRELERVVRATRAEKDCLSIRAFESVSAPAAFGVHSEWADEEAFDFHVTLPHTARFITQAERLLGHPIAGLRAKEI